MIQIVQPEFFEEPPSFKRQKLFIEISIHKLKQERLVWVSFIQSLFKQ